MALPARVLAHTSQSSSSRTRSFWQVSPLGARLGIAMAGLALTLWTQWGSPASVSLFANEWLRDRFLQMQVSTAPEPRILVVDIDEASLARLGPWPWPQARIADLVEILLSSYGARGVALDIVFPKSSGAQGEQRLALMARHGPLVLAQAFDYQSGRLQPLREGVLGGALTAGAPAPAAVATGYIANHAQLAGAAHVGNIGFIPDSDGVLRRVPLITRFDGRDFPALGLALVNCCSSGPALAPASGELARVSYRRDWNAYTVVSAADVLDQSLRADGASARLVLVGSSSLGQADRVATPLAANRPGLGVQAIVLSDLLDRQAGLSPAPWPGRLLASLFALASVIAVSLAFPRVSALTGVALLGASSVLWLGLAYAASGHDPHFSTTGPLATNLFLLAVAVPYQWQLTQRKSRYLLDTLRQYVAPAVVAELLDSDVDDPLKPRQLDVTTLIADMEGYTSQVESLPVQEAALLTRDFLDCLTGPVIGHQGTLDKYTGDGLVAFWGAPLPVQHHADLALDAAREMLTRVAQLSARRVAAGRAPLRVRIGIESGLAMAGDFGTSFRSIYTAVGDSVNTASRLEQAARDFPHDVIVGAGAVARATRHRFLPLGERLLRGKEKATALFTFATDAASAADAAPVGVHA